MKECTSCRSCFPDHINYCPLDGHQTLQSIAGEPILDGRYQLEKRLGQGGMGVVYKAHHVFLKTAHAIKVILPDLVGNDPTLATRFRQEAMAAAAIRHPNIIAVTDYGLIKGVMPFLVMEFIPGRSLHELLETEGKFSPERAMQFMIVVTAGVGAAHQRGVVHRDLKPLNIMIEDNKPLAEAIKILDFGLAKIKSGDLLGSFLVAQTTGMIGSPHYMAPEQWSDEEPDRRADIYSLGIVLYQMLAGNVPFDGAAVPTIMKKHLMSAPPHFAEFGVDVPPAVERVVRHALEKDPELRPPTAEEFIRELRAAVIESVAPAGRPPALRTGFPEVEEGTRTTQRLRVESRRHAEEEARRKAEEATRLRVEEEARQREEEEMRLRAEAEAVRKRAEEEARRKAEEEATRLRAEEEAREREAEQARLRADAEAARKRAEEEARRRAEEEAARLRAAEEARKREEEARLRAEAEAARKRAEEEARRKAEEEAARLRAAEEARKLEEARLRAEAEAARKQAEEEARRKAEKEAARLRAAEEARQLEEQARLRAEAEARQREQEEARRKAEEEAARLRAAEEARKQKEEEARLRAEAEAARKREEKARRKAEQEAARVRVEEEATLQIAPEEAAQRKLQEDETEKRSAEQKAREQAEEAARREADEDAAWRRAEEEIRRRNEEEAARWSSTQEQQSAQEQRSRLTTTIVSDDTIGRGVSAHPLGETQAFQNLEQVAKPAEHGPVAGDTMVSNFAPPVTAETIPRHTFDVSAQSAPIDSSVPPFELPAQKKSSLVLYVGVAVLVLLLGGGVGVYLLTRPTTSVTSGSEQPPSGNPPAQPASHPRDMVFIQGGTFQMGRDDGPDNEKPPHSVNVKSFYIDPTEVTNAQYAEYVQVTNLVPTNKPINDKDKQEYWKPWVGIKPPAGQEDWPVRNVSEAEAEAYARWLSNRDGLKYRLPTEEEWEYVARNGGSTKLYPWGNEWKDGYANTSSKSVSAVKSFKQGATKSGVFDMIGNVWEWTSSKVSAYSGNKEWNVPPEDQGRMVIRGGSYQSKIGADQPSTSTGRNWLDPSDKHPTVGFRLVREAP